MNVFIVRHGGYSHNPVYQEKVMEELKKGKFRQGWSSNVACVLKENVAIVAKDEWCKRTGYNARRYNMLCILLEMKKGDILIIPKSESSNVFTIARVNEEYTFEILNSIGDLGHIIGVDVSTIRTFNYNANPYAKTIHSKLRAYQSSVNRVWNSDIIKAAEELLGEESSLEALSQDELFEEMIEKNLSIDIEKIRESFEKMHNQDIEKIVGNIFESKDYVIIKAKYFDKKGGDADIIARGVLPLINTTTNIYIQVKHKKGENYNETEGITQLEKIVQTDIDNGNIESTTNICKILVCTAKNYHEDIIKLAESNDTKLIDGTELARLYLSFVLNNKE